MHSRNLCKSLMAFPPGRATIRLMQTALETPADAARKAAEDLARASRKQAAVNGNNDWRTAIGAMEDSPDSREAWNLGEQWRRSITDP